MCTKFKSEAKRRSRKKRSSKTSDCVVVPLLLSGYYDLAREQLTVCLWVFVHLFFPLNYIFIFFAFVFLFALWLENSLWFDLNSFGLNESVETFAPSTKSYVASHCSCKQTVSEFHKRFRMNVSLWLCGFRASLRMRNEIASSLGRRCRYRRRSESSSVSERKSQVAQWHVHGKGYCAYAVPSDCSK